MCNSSNKVGDEFFCFVFCFLFCLCQVLVVACRRDLQSSLQHAGSLVAAYELLAAACELLVAACGI